jgi:hypothetical protein
MIPNNWCFDTHIHTSYSNDAYQSVKHTIKRARQTGLSAIAITDHNTIQGAETARQLNEDGKIMIIVGEEVASEYGDIIGIFLNELLVSKSFSEIIDEIHNQGGICILPHPMRRKKFPPPDQMKALDLFETINARTSSIRNEEARQLAVTYKKMEIAGSDSHFLWEIGAVWNIVSPSEISDEEELRTLIRSGDFHIHQNIENPVLKKSNMALSYLIKHVRKPFLMDDSILSHW